MSISEKWNEIQIAAAFFNGAFSIDWVQAAVNSKASDVIAALEDLREQGLLTSLGMGLYRFNDQAVRKKIMDSLAAADKENLHRIIAEILWREMGENQNLAVEAADQLIQAPLDPDNIKKLAEAGDLLVQIYKYKEALKCYTRVINETSGLGSAEAGRLFIETVLKYSKYSTARDDAQWVIALLKKAVSHAEKTGLKAYAALLLMHLAKNQWLLSRFKAATRNINAGFAMAREINDAKLLHSAAIFMTFFHFWQGRFKDAAALYEKSAPALEKYPSGGFSLITASTAGMCYALVGQLSQGLGMLNAIRAHCHKIGDTHMAGHAGVGLGIVLLNIGLIDDAVVCLEASLKETSRGHNAFQNITSLMLLAYAYYLKENEEKCLKCLSDLFNFAQKSGFTARPFPYILDLAWAVETGRLPDIPELSFDRELNLALKGRNIFMKGMGYRYKAFKLRRQGRPAGMIIAALEHSQKCLEESGHQVELAKTKVELAREYILLGHDQTAKPLSETAAQTLAAFNKDLVPEELKHLVKELYSGDNLLKEILKLGRELVTIRDHRELVRKIISTVNRITGAERGAIFDIEKNNDKLKAILKAAHNLTNEETGQSIFKESMDMILKTADSGRGIIKKTPFRDSSSFNAGEAISSLICVPMVLRDNVVGVLYHDNRILGSTFKESDLEILSYFGAQAAIALDNARAYEKIKGLNRRLKEEKRHYEEQYLQRLHYDEIIGESPAIMNVVAQVHRVAGTDATTLILGETGVGKELAARAIHQNSPRKNKPFISVNCSAFTESLISSELFGHEKGAFTGAHERRIGRFELADGGTLFLDEIGDIPMEVQVRLLRVLQTREFERVGGMGVIRSNFRLIAATNRDISADVKAGKFRADLYYRLNVIPITVPPLRERKSDVQILAHFFLGLHSSRLGKTMDKIPDAEMEKLLEYDWPGNVRELENIIERSLILSSGPDFTLPELKAARRERSGAGVVTLEENERHHILWALQETGGKVRGPDGAAGLLDIHPNTLYSRMKKLGIKKQSSFIAARS